MKIPIFCLLTVSGDLITVSSSSTLLTATTEPNPATQRRGSPRLPPPLGTEIPGSRLINGVIVAAEPRPSTPRPRHQWTPWSPWSTCPEECKRGHSRARTRACRDGETWATLPDLKPCLQNGGSNVEIGPCPSCDDRDKGERRQSYF